MMDAAEPTDGPCIGYGAAADMPRPTDPPRRLADRVRRARLALLRHRRRQVELEEILYLAAYHANQNGWTQRGLAEALGEPPATVQNWIEVGERLHTQRATAE